MLRDAVRSLLREPRAPHPPRRVWRDWVLVAGVVVAAVLEGVLSKDVAWRPAAVALAVATAFALLWRRTYPVQVVVGVFSALILVNGLVLVSGSAPVGLNAMLCVALLPYS